VAAVTGRRSAALHVAQSVETGVAHVVADHVAEQVKAGWRAVVACPGGRLAELAQDRGAEVVRWQAERQPGWSVVREARDLAALVDRVDPAVVHLHSAKAGLVGRLVVRGRRPTVFTPHAWSWLAVSGGVAVQARAWERFATRWTDLTIGLSAGEIREARDAGIRTLPVLIPNDVPVEDVRRAAPASRSAARARLGVAPEARVVVCCARLAPQKGQDLLIEAWRDVTTRIPDVQLVLVGDGPSRDELRAVAAGVPGVEFVGMAPREEALLWMKAATVVCCPSRYEGMSLVPLEAAALGVPVVASDVEGMAAEVPLPFRKLVPPGDVAGLADALSSLLADPEAASRAGRVAAAWADEQAARPSAAAKVLALYRELVGYPAPAREERLSWQTR
jgi:glycosyltransferase involved in cell wall biosynthesis